MFLTWKCETINHNKNNITTTTNYNNNNYGDDDDDKGSTETKNTSMEINAPARKLCFIIMYISLYMSYCCFTCDFAIVDSRKANFYAVINNVCLFVSLLNV